MKTLLIISTVFVLFFAVVLKLLITNQETKINLLNGNITTVDLKIEKIKNNYTYDIRPQNLKEINENEFNLVPILQIDIINKKEIFENE